MLAGPVSGGWTPDNLFSSLYVSALIFFYEHTLLLSKIFRKTSFFPQLQKSTAGVLMKSEESHGSSDLGVSRPITKHLLRSPCRGVSPWERTWIGSYPSFSGLLSLVLRTAGRCPLRRCLSQQNNQAVSIHRDQANNSRDLRTMEICYSDYKEPSSPLVPVGTNLSDVLSSEES